MELTDHLFIVFCWLGVNILCLASLCRMPQVWLRNLAAMKQKAMQKKLLSQLHSEKVIQKVILDFYSKVLPFGCMLWYR